MDQFSCPTVPLKRQRENSVRSVSDLCPIKVSYRVPIRGCLVRSKNFIGYASRGSRVVEAIKEFYRGYSKTPSVQTTCSTAMAAIIENFYGGLLADWFLLLVERVRVPMVACMRLGLPVLGLGHTLTLGMFAR